MSESTARMLIGNVGQPVPQWYDPVSDMFRTNTNSASVNAASGNVAAAVASATLPAVAGKTNFLTGFTVSGAGATAALPVIVTVTGVLGGTLSYVYVAAVGVLAANQPLNMRFNPPLQAAAANTAIVVSCPSLGLGNTHNSTVANGFAQ